MRRPLILIVLAASVLSAQEKIPLFEPMQPELLGAGSTFTNAFADFDGDGDPDMFVGFDGKPNRLYRNDQGTFADVAAAATVYGRLNSASCVVRGARLASIGAPTTL